MNRKILAIFVCIAMLVSALSAFTYAADVEIDLSDLFGPDDSETETPSTGDNTGDNAGDNAGDNKDDTAGDNAGDNNDDEDFSSDNEKDDDDDEKDSGNSSRPSSRPSSNSNKNNSSSKDDDNKEEVTEKEDEKKEEEEEKTEEPKEWVNPFSDVKDGIWYYDTVKYVTENGIMNGMTASEFSPDASLTRAMLVTILYRIEGEPEIEAESKFSDVLAKDWYFAPIVWASENGIVNGVSDTEFAPNNNITREQIAAIIYRYASAKGYDVTQGGMAVKEFEDYEAISSWAQEAMQWAVNTKLISGTTETTVAPLENATRAQAATIIMRFIEANK